MSGKEPAISKPGAAAIGNAFLQALISLGLVISLLSLQGTAATSFEGLPLAAAADSSHRWRVAAPRLAQDSAPRLSTLVAAAAIDIPPGWRNHQTGRSWGQGIPRRARHVSTTAAVLSSPRPLLLPPIAQRGTVTGLATYYAEPYHGRPMRNGEIYDMNDPTVAASNTWPLGTVLRVTRLPGSPNEGSLSGDDLEGLVGASLVVTVKDTGTFSHALDLSRAAFARLGRLEEGVIRVRAEVVSEQ